MFKEGNGWDSVSEVFNQIASDIVKFIPKILIALVIILIAIAIIKVLNFSFRKLLKMAKIDEFFTKITGVSLPLSITN